LRATCDAEVLAELALEKIGVDAQEVIDFADQRRELRHFPVVQETAYNRSAFSRQLFGRCGRGQNRHGFGSRLCRKGD
jgi:hypothetical protein